MKVNTYGLKMTGLRKAAGETKCLRGTYDPNYVQISYDYKAGKVYAHSFYDLGHSWRMNFASNHIVDLGILCFPATMQLIADMIKERMKENENSCSV